MLKQTRYWASLVGAIGFLVISVTHSGATAVAALAGVWAAMAVHTNEEILVLIRNGFTTEEVV